VIVTGGNRGIGRAISETIAKAGGAVAIIYNSAKDAEDVAAQIAKEHGVKVQAFQCDVGKQDRVQAVFKEIDEKMGPVTGLVANSGVSIVKPAVDMTKEDFSFVCECRVPERKKRKKRQHSQSNHMALCSCPVRGSKVAYPADDVNVFGCFASAQAMAKIWIERGYKQGSIIFTSSMSSQIVNKGTSPGPGQLLMLRHCSSVL
jgi:NAD(P)-dependent dehydrogenase (short-subunit alcohol dehydrogenase family)